MSKHSLSVLACAAVIGIVTGSAYAYEVLDPDRVYYGDAYYFSNPAVVKASEVFAKIPEYREIVSRGLKPKDPEYWLLLSKANEKFAKAVAKVAQQDGYDLVAEVGTAIAEEGETDPPDVTANVIRSL